MTRINVVFTKSPTHLLRERFFGLDRKPWLHVPRLVRLVGKSRNPICLKSLDTHKGKEQRGNGWTLLFKLGKKIFYSSLYPLSPTWGILMTWFALYAPEIPLWCAYLHFDEAGGVAYQLPSCWSMFATHSYRSLALTRPSVTRLWLLRKLWSKWVSEVSKCGQPSKLLISKCESMYTCTSLVCAIHRMGGRAQESKRCIHGATEFKVQVVGP